MDELVRRNSGVGVVPDDQGDSGGGIGNVVKGNSGVGIETRLLRGRIVLYITM